MVLKKQAGELEAALRAKSELEAELRVLRSELQTVKNSASQTESELKQMEAQVSQESVPEGTRGCVCPHSVYSCD